MPMLMRKIGSMTDAAPSASSLNRSVSSKAPLLPFHITLADHDDVAVVTAWRRLLDAGQSPEKLYQSPEFFRYLKQQGQGELLIVKQGDDKQIRGVIPVRRIVQALDFRVGSLVLFSLNIAALQIFGSIPLLEAGIEGLGEFVHRTLLEQNKGCLALFMQAVPRELYDQVGKGRGLSSYALHGWRDCHTMPLPDDFPSYLQKFSAKKRYNLTRQVRLLSEKAGEARAVRIDQPDQVGQLTAALQKLMDADQLAAHGDPQVLAQLAAHGLLHAYVIRCGDQDVAVVLGKRSQEVWHVHKICCDQQYLSLSIGTSAMHLALQDVITHFSFTHADFGYGTPNQEFRSTHVMKSRANIMLYRSRSAAALLFRLHGWHDRFNEALIRMVKGMRGRYAEYRRKRAKPAKAAAEAGQ